MFNTLKNWFQSSVRLIVTGFICGLLFVSSAFPAQAASNVTEGEANLNRIQKETDEVAESTPRGIKEITEKAQGGLNEVQGAADKDKMIRPEESDAETFADKANDFFKGLTE